MITELRIQNFKSWADTGLMRLAPITGLFGANSSGKTSILQFLLMLKQTVEAMDRSRVLNLGDDRSLVDLGTFEDVIHDHLTTAALDFFVRWKSPESSDIRLSNWPSGQRRIRLKEIGLGATIRAHATASAATSRIYVEQFSYNTGDMVWGMRLIEGYPIEHAQDIIRLDSLEGYQLTVEGYDLESSQEPRKLLPAPIRFYGFPVETYVYYTNVSFLPFLASSFELYLLGKIFYLGPLREYPHRTYLWGGERPRDVGPRGEATVHALMASQSEGVVERVVEWLKAMGLIYDFSLQPIAPGRKEYEVKLKRNADSAEVLLTDVGFGVSQILPVLTLCYYVPEGSILLLEQPEIHLHPSVQAALADVFIDAVKTRNLQIILESHSEHLLRRLQRRIAEESLSADQAALYFCEMADGASRLIPLQLDEYGNISNWPRDFFGDELGELTAMTTAAMERQQAGNGAG